MSPKKPAPRATKRKHPTGRWSAIVPARIRTLMADFRLTQAEFATRAGVKSSAVSHWLSGRNLPRAEELRALCNAFEVTADWFLGVEFAPQHRRDWPATSSTFAEMLAVEVLRDLPPDVADVAGDLAVCVERVLEDARDAVQREARELADAMGWADRELMSDFHDAMQIVSRLRDWIGESRRADAGRMGHEAANASLLLSSIRLNLHNVRPRTFSASGTDEMRYLRLSATGRRVWSAQGDPVASVERAWSPRLKRWQSRPTERPSDAER